MGNSIQVKTIYDWTMTIDVDSIAFISRRPEPKDRWVSTVVMKTKDCDEGNHEFHFDEENTLKLEKAKAKSPFPHQHFIYFKDGNQWCCVFPDFDCLANSSAGFGIDPTAAYNDLMRKFV